MKLRKNLMWHPFLINLLSQKDLTYETMTRAAANVLCQNKKLYHLRPSPVKVNLKTVYPN